MLSCYFLIATFTLLVHADGIIFDVCPGYRFAPDAGRKADQPQERVKINPDECMDWWNNGNYGSLSWVSDGHTEVQSWPYDDTHWSTCFVAKAKQLSNPIEPGAVNKAYVAYSRPIGSVNVTNFPEGMECFKALHEEVGHCDLGSGSIWGLSGKCIKPGEDGHAGESKADRCQRENIRSDINFYQVGCMCVNREHRDTTLGAQPCQCLESAPFDHVKLECVPKVAVPLELPGKQRMGRSD